MPGLLRRRGAAVEPEPAAPEPEPRAGAKGRPTPSRAEARARRATAPPPANRKEARRSSAARRREAAEANRAAMRQTDPSKLPAIERRPERVVARDVVDSRPSAGPLLLVAFFLEIVGGLAKSPVVQAPLVALLYLALFLAIVDSTWRVHQVRKAVREQVSRPTSKFTYYTIARGLLPKRWRRPVARV